jgi:hypothetical protein
MKHEIKIERYERKADKKVFVRASLHGLAGADSFFITSSAEDIDDALREMAIRLQLVSEDAENIAHQLLDGLKDEKDEEDSSEQTKDGPDLKLI